MVIQSLSLTYWPIESHVELDSLEDIFKENGRENALKPVLSTVLAPGLCAIYSTFVFSKYIHGKDFQAKSTNNQCPNNAKKKDHRTTIRFHVEEVDSKDSSKGSSSNGLSPNERPRSPNLLSPPVANITLGKEIFPKDSIAVFVSGPEAERQRQDLRVFGFDVAPRLAERRASYAKRFTKEERDENAFIQYNIEQAVKNKIKQLQTAEELDSKGTSRMERRAKLWRRCANMAEMLAKEEAETFLFRMKYHNAALHVFGSYDC